MEDEYKEPEIQSQSKESAIENEYESEPEEQDDNKHAVFDKREIIQIADNLISEDPNMIADCIMTLAKAFTNYESEIPTTLTLPAHWGGIAFFIQEFDPNVTATSMKMLQYYVKYSEKQEQINLLFDVYLPGILGERLRSEIPFEYANDIIALFTDIVTRLSESIAQIESLGITTVIVNIINMFSIDGNPFRHDPNCEQIPYLQKEGIDISQERQELVKRCFDYVQAVLVNVSEWEKILHKEALYYLFIYINGGDEYALMTLWNLVDKRISATKFEILIENFINSQCYRKVFDLMTKDNLYAWRIVCDTLTGTSMTKRYADLGLFSFLLFVAQNPDKMILEGALVCLQTLTYDNYDHFCDYFVTTELFDLILKFVDSGTTRIKIFSSIVIANTMYHDHIAEVMQKYDQFTLSALNLILLGNEKEAASLISTLQSVVQAANSNGMNVPEVFGGEEGEDLMEEILEQISLNIYPEALALNNMIFGKEEEE